MGVIYKILRQQRLLQQQQQQQQQQQHHQKQQQSSNMDLNTATKCKVQAVIKQRQVQRFEEQQQEQQLQQLQREQDDSLAEQRLQQLCRFLAENAARKKRQHLKRYHEYHQVAVEAQSPQSAASTHDMDLLMELSTCDEAAAAAAAAAATEAANLPASSAPRDSILLKIRHQIFERKRQRQRQVVELMNRRLVVWRPW